MSIAFLLLVGCATATFAAAEPPDYPADKCVFLQTIPYDEPLDPYSVQLINDLKAASGSQIRLRLGEWTMSAYWVNGSNYQLEDIYVSNGYCPMGYWLRDVPFPTDQVLKATLDSDANLSIVDPVHGMEYNFWAIKKDRKTGLWLRNSSGYYECKNAGAAFTSTAGSNPIACSMRGPSIAHSIGLVKPGELATGQINHALALCFATGPAWDPCPPATYSDGNDFSNKQYPQRLPESAVIRLKPSVWTDAAINAQPWTLTEKALARAARDYGIYITDNGGATDLYANNFHAYPSDPYVNIDGCRMEQRSASGNYVYLWTAGFLDPANFEVPDRIFFPYPRDDRWLDYDGDGITNAAETAWGYRNSTLYVEHNDPSNGPLDWDNDGLTNAQECQLRNNFRYLPASPFDTDSDGDGYTDYQEANNWSADPTDPFVTPDPAWPGLPSGANLALGKPASSSFSQPQNAVDGNENTYCGGGPNTGYFQVDLGSVMNVSRVIIKWALNGHNFPAKYNVQVSTNGSSWTTIYTDNRGRGGRDDVYTWSGQARYVKTNATETGSPWGTYIREFEVYGPGGGAPPVANFSGNPTSGTAPLTVMFTDLSSNSPTSWSWTFGDGGTSTAQNPSHSYAAGTYTVSLTATNQYGSDGETKNNYITVTSGGQPPVAQFVGNPTSGAAPLTVNFTDQSSHSPTAWSWSFGDGGSATMQNPGHQYTSTGQFTVSLTAANQYGSDDEVKTNYITVTSGGQPPVAQFVGNPTSGTVPLTVAFTDQSSNSPTAWSWSFGDSGTSTAQNPSHQYTSTGQFTVSLTATNQYGSDDEVKSNYITVTSGGGGQDYTCASATILNGTLVSGDHTNTHASDDSYLVVNSVAVTGQQSTVIQYSFNTGLSSLSSLTVTTEWRHQGVTTAQNQRTSLYNFSSGSWVEVDRRSVLAINDTTVEIPISSPSPYLSTSGEVRLKLWTGDAGKTAWSHYIDLVKITAAP